MRSIPIIRKIILGKHSVFLFFDSIKRETTVSNIPKIVMFNSEGGAIVINAMAWLIKMLGWSTTEKCHTSKVVLINNMITIDGISR